MAFIVKKNGRVIAWHEDKSVCKKYLENWDLDRNDKYKIKKVPISEIEDYMDLYLLRQDNIYIPEKFLATYEICNNDSSDIRQAISTLSKVKLMDDLSNKETKHILGAIEVLYGILDDMDNYQPTIEELETLKDHYDEYFNKI